LNVRRPLINHESELKCQINGQDAYFEVYIESAADAINEAGWILTDLTDQDTAVSFVWGADFAGGACIGLVSIALIDYCNAIVYYMDDQMRYTREMLIADTVQFLSELEKQYKSKMGQTFTETQQGKSEHEKNIWKRLKNIFK